MKTLDSVAAKARYLENLSLLGLRESDNPYIEHSHCKFIDHNYASLKCLLFENNPPMRIISIFASRVIYPKPQRKSCSL